MNKWKYKIDISCNGVFGEIEKKYGIKFSDELKAFITEYNAATPEKHRFMVGTTERVFGAVLSVNKGETDTDSIYTALDVINDKDIIPFAIDPSPTKAITLYFSPLRSLALAMPRAADIAVPE